VQGFSYRLWDTVKVEIVESGNFHRFMAHGDLKAKLLATRDAELVEAAKGDRIWGYGFAEKNAEANRMYGA
jgi:ribA/ribD-fused uncharacterized protein